MKKKLVEESIFEHVFNQGWEFAFLLFRSKSLFLKRSWAICSQCSVIKSNRERIALVALSKRVTVSELLIIFSLAWKNLFFTAFLPFMPKSEALPSLFSPSLFFKVCNRSGLLSSLFTKEQLWAIRSHPSFAHKKRVIRSKTQRANSQPCIQYHYLSDGTNSCFLKAP